MTQIYKTPVKGIEIKEGLTYSPPNREIVLQISKIKEGIAYIRRLDIPKEDYTFYTINEVIFLRLDSGEWLVREAGEIVGYELLKDLPGIPAGTIGNKVLEANTYKGHWQFKGNRSEYYNQVEILDTTWFKPIYKPKEVIVEISGGRMLTFEKANVYLDDKVEWISNKEFIALYNTIYTYNNITVQTGRKGYPLVIESFKIGCIVFTKEDAELVYKTIQSLK